jgi:putative CocE/NonD family hydrolase
MLIDAGPRDQRPAQALPDYGLIYRGEELKKDLTIAGTVRVTLCVQSDCPDTDFVAKLIERLPDGRAMLLMDGVVRAMYRDGSAEPQPLVSDQVYRLTIGLGDIHHTFQAGSRIEVDITSSNFPRRARNTNSGHPLLAGERRGRHPRRHQHDPSRRGDSVRYRIARIIGLGSGRLVTPRRRSLRRILPALWRRRP